MEEQLSAEEMRIIEYLKVLSDSTESDGQVKELSKKFLGALEERTTAERHQPHIIINSFPSNSSPLVEPGSYVSKDWQTYRPDECGEWFSTSSIFENFRPSLAV